VSDAVRDPESGSALAELIAANRAGAEQVEEGRFRLDWERALDKIKRFQLADPHRYVLELVPAAVASGAQGIEVTTDADDVYFRFDGQPYSEAELTRLFDYLFAQDLELARVRQLALAVNSALGLQPKWVVVESGDGQVGWRMRLTSYKDLRVEPLRGEEVPKGTLVHVRERVSWKVVGDLFRSDNAEDRLLAENCVHAPFPLLLNGVDLRRPIDVLARARRSFEMGAVRGEIALPSEPTGASSIELCMGGVRIVSVADTAGNLAGPVGVRGWVDHPALSRNASHSDVHRDEHFDECFSAVRMAVREMLAGWVDATLLGEAERGDGDAAERQFSAVELTYLRAAAQLLLRADQKSPLPAGLEALLDVPGIVELAVSRPACAPLRLLWDSYREQRKWHAASERHDLSLDELPAGMIPALGPPELLRAVFPTGREDADKALAEIARGVYNRRRREKLRQEAQVSPADVVVKQAVADAKHAIRGEIGLVRNDRGDCLGTLTWMLAFGKTGAHIAPRKCGVHTVFLRDGVYLGEQLVSAPVRHALAIVDSPGFEPTADWEDLFPNETSDAVAALLGAAVPTLLEEMARAVPDLPPPGRLREAGYWRAETGRRDGAPPELSAAWPLDRFAQEVRWHVDVILEEHDKLERDTAPWLWEWPLFFALDGRAMSLAELEAVEGKIRYVVEQPWGSGTPKDALFLNVSAQQQNVLRRYLPSIRGGKSSLAGWRTSAEMAAEIAERRRQNRALAEGKRQSPHLDAGSYAAVVDLALAEGEGQVGIPLSLEGPSWIRYLIDGLPLPDELEVWSVPAHVVASTPLARADDAFEKQIANEAAVEVERAVQDAIPDLVARFAATASASSDAGRVLIWSYLETLKGAKTKKKDPLSRIPEAIASFALVPTVDRGRISLRQIFDDASQHKRRSLVTMLMPDRQLTERPILVCREDKRKILRRVLGVTMHEYTRELEQELAVLDRMKDRKVALLDEPTVVKISFDENGMVGQLGVPAESGHHARGTGHWVRVLRDGVPLERVPLSVDGIPFIAVVDCPRFRPTSRWDSVVRDDVWKEALAVLRRASEQLVLLACSDLAERGTSLPAFPSVARALRNMAGQRFRGRPWLCGETDPEVERALAGAPVWQSAAVGDGLLSLRQISDARSDSGEVWVVGEEVGHVAPGHVIVQALDNETSMALSSIYGGGVRDGREVLRRDEEAYQRRQQAPALETTLPPSRAIATQRIERTDSELGVKVRGEVAICRDYCSAAKGKLVLRLALESRFLCERKVAHELRGLGNLDCNGLTPNRDWNGVVDDKKLRFVERLAAEALWQSAEEFAVGGVFAAPSSAAHEHEQTLLEEALLRLAPERDERPGLRERLMSMRLFGSVRGDRLSADQLVEIAGGSSDGLLVVSDALGEGEPEDGRLVVRASEIGIRVLEHLLGSAVHRHDEAWKAELAGQRRRRELPEASPSLTSDVAAQLYFQEDETYGMIGLLRPREAAGSDDESDPTSVLCVHVGRRKVTERQVVWHPAVEVWINNDRLRTSPGFDDVLPDETFTRALHLAASQIPELLVRAAEACQRSADEPLRLRICNYVLTRVEQLQARAEEAPSGAEHKLLDAQLWRSLTGAGARTMSTRQLVAASEAGRLRTVSDSASGRPATSDVIVVRASEDELRWLGETFGGLEDYTGQLEQDEALRGFLSRPPVEALTLSLPADFGTLLHRRALSGSGWEGEIGIRSDAGRALAVWIYWQHRWLVTREISAPISAAAVVQSDELMVDGQYRDVVADPAYKAFVNRLIGELWAALHEMVRSLDQVHVASRAAVRRICVRALAASHARTDAPSIPVEVATALRAAPLFVDARGRSWSIDGLLATVAGGERVAAVSPDTAVIGEPLGDRPVLVVDHGAWEDVAVVLPLERFDSEFVESIEGRARRERAETSFRLRRRDTLVRAEGVGPGFRGEIGLSVAGEDGWLVLFSDGRQVGKRRFPDCPGLVGSIDGKLATDRGFLSVNLTDEQSRSIRALYQERLQAAVADARTFSGLRRSRRWSALCQYVLLYIGGAFGALAGGLDERRDRISRRDPSLPPRLLAACEVPVLRRNDGAWIDLATAVGGEAPAVVITRDRIKDPPDAEVILLVGDPDRLRPFFATLLGARSVSEYADWMQHREAEAAKREAARQKREEARRKKLLVSVKSMLRDALDRHPASDLHRADAGRLKRKALGGARLTVPGGKAGKLVQIDTDHAVWQAAVEAAGTSEVADRHLAAAILVDIACWDEPRLTSEDLSALLARIARR